MKKTALIFTLLWLCLSVFAQQIQEESVVINIEVPVRVFDGDTFVENLTIDDFEVYEDGILQRLEAVYLVKKRSIERSEEKRRFTPDTARNFYLLFEISEYTGKLGEAVEYFIQNVIYPGDILTIITPIKTYRLRGQALEVKTRDEITEQLKGILRKDALIGSGEYRSMMDDLTSLAGTLTASLSQDPNLRVQDQNLDAGQLQMSVDEQLTRYEDLLHRLESLRHVDQKQLIDFAQTLDEQSGQKYVFLFYEREYIPQIDSRILYQYTEMYQDSPNIQQSISGIFEFYRRDINIDVNRVKEVYADSSVAIHFLFIARAETPRFGIRYQEQSEDIFSTFKQMADATGGFIDSSYDPSLSFQRALVAAENYYLLYYSPQNFQLDGKFKDIQVRLKEKSYRVVHRLGYFAD
jgi:VWFA-related protein